MAEREQKVEAVQPIIHDIIVQSGTGWTVDFERSSAEAIVDALDRLSPGEDEPEAAHGLHEPQSQDEATSPGARQRQGPAT